MRGGARYACRPSLLTMSVLGDDVIRARVAANLRSVSVLVLDSVIGAGEGDLAGGLHLDGIRGAAGAQRERGRSDESGGCQDASCDDNEPNRTGKYEGRTLFR